MMRSVIAVAAGYLSMAILVMLATIVSMKVMLPAGVTLRSMRESKTMPAPSPAYVRINLAYSFLFAIVGGWVCARLAPSHPMRHVGALAGLILILALPSALKALRSSERATGGQPGWYAAVIGLVGAAGALLGGSIVAR